MAITSLKFESYYRITHIKKGLSDEEIIKKSREEFDCILDLRDLKEIRKHYNDCMIKYIHNF